MAASYVNVTEGSGKKLNTWQRTIGANAVEDQYTLHGEPALATYGITTSASVSLATANAHAIQVMAGSSLNVRIRRIEVHQAQVATTATIGSLILLRLTTAGTGGTSITPQLFDPADSAAGCTAMTLPTVKGTEGVFLAIAYPYLMQTIGASAQLNQPIAVFDFDRLRSKPIVIAAGTANGIAIKSTTAVAGAAVSFNVIVDESSF